MAEMMSNTLQLYQRSSNNIWTDAHIAQNMLKAHLDYTHDAASRNRKAIQRTVDWIDGVAEGKRTLIDLGCGPGIYAQAFANLGYTVTGVDISSSSLAYAKHVALAANQPITYLCQDYVTTPLPGRYDLAICIYCDFGALIPPEQARFLKHVHAALAENGLLILDVFGPGLCRVCKEERSWRYQAAAGFWSATPHYELSEHLHFSAAKAWGHRTIILEEGGPAKTYINWDQYYTEAEITGVLACNGFTVEVIQTDLVEENSFTSNDVLFVKARKSA